METKYNVYKLDIKSDKEKSYEHLNNKEMKLLTRGYKKATRKNDYRGAGKYLTRKGSRYIYLVQEI